MKTGRLGLAAYLRLLFLSPKGVSCGCLHSVFRNGGFAGAYDCQLDLHKQPSPRLLIIFVKVKAGEISQSTNVCCRPLPIESSADSPILYNPLDDGIWWGIICRQRNAYHGEPRRSHHNPISEMRNAYPVFALPTCAGSLGGQGGSAISGGGRLADVRQ
jgi:hypothetical protein